MTEFPKLLMVLGGILLFVGLFMQVVGRLPGDIVVKKGNFTFFFPIVTCIVISLLLTFIFSFLGRFK
ncbi:DUF2905 domain-containing protein [Aeribacillus composti]|uniref:DUF2905 domain-containing protein n=1 Tax=Aeribacillus composti TaxID=1868734 RepID=A0ABY9WBQ2_9BACI|nr:DUF2905 domain-containing protein [Aeribacillus composti]MED1442285.1 DUF2905 domain-containing protein [Aeribacillus composti]WNF32245.1 DUF2905 domain-containing protein [Aeribacillus composti]